MSCSIDSRNKQSPTYEVVHETKRKLTSEISNRFLLIVKNPNAKDVSMEGDIFTVNDSAFFLI